MSFFGFIFPCFYVYAKAVDEACMVKNVKASKLTEGDWLYQDVKINKKLIKANWEGLSLDDIKVLQKKSKSVLVRYGIPFVPVFLISFLILVFIYFWGYFGF